MCVCVCGKEGGRGSSRSTVREDAKMKGHSRGDNEVPEEPHGKESG